MIDVNNESIVFHQKSEPCIGISPIVLSNESIVFFIRSLEPYILMKFMHFRTEKKSR